MAQKNPGAPTDFELWVPNDFAGGAATDAYVLRGTHRGDMYQVRAGFWLSPMPIIVYGSAENDLTGYLQKGCVAKSKDFFHTTWEWGVLSGTDDPGDKDVSLKGKFTKRLVHVYSESAATYKIRELVKGEAELKLLRQGMAYISDDKDREDLLAEFKPLCQKLFTAPKPGKFTILLQCRDTGMKGGIYPELDSGDASIVQIANSILAMNKMGSKFELSPELCGNTADIGSLPGIGEYFLHLNAKKYPKQSKRDIEAFFLQVAFQLGYFHMVIGFRSGGLDLFTLMGVPSISIGLRQLVGEGRHSQLALNDALRRRNLQYEMPRHVCTRFSTQKGATELMGSPWWKLDTSTAPTSEEQALQAQPPSGFHEFDEEIIKIFVFKSIRDLLDWRVDPDVFVRGVQGNVWDNSSCRTAFYNTVSHPDKMKPFKEAQVKKEVADFELRLKERALRKETEANYEQAKKYMEQAWGKLKIVIPWTTSTST